MASKLTSSSLTSYASNASPTFTGTVKTNEIDTVSPNNAVNVLSNLNVYGELRVDTIGNYDSLPSSISFVTPCVIGAALSNQPLTVNGTLIAKNVTISDTLSCNALSVTGFIPAKPYVSGRVATTGGTPSSVSGSLLTIGTPGTTVFNNYGFITPVLSRGTAGAVNSFIYTFTWTGAHPLGTNYAVFAQFQTGSSGSSSQAQSLQPTGIITTNVTSSTSFNVWIRTPLDATYNNVLVDGTFYVHTVP